MRMIDADKVDFSEVFIGNSDFARDAREAAYNLLSEQPAIDELVSGVKLANIACLQIRYKQALALLEEAAETIENCYGRETELSEKIRKALGG